MSNKIQRAIVLWFASICVFISFSILMYIILYMNQYELLKINIDADKQMLESLIGWELTRQILWAALIIPCIIGIFFTAIHLKEKNSTYNTFILTSLYFGFIFALEYCILKLVWSYQITRIYESKFGTIPTRTDIIQNFLFNADGTMSFYGTITISTLLGIIAALFFLLVQVEAEKRVSIEEKIGAEKEERESTAQPAEDFEKIREIAPLMAEKLVKAGIKSLKDLADSDKKKVAEALNISEESASVLINVASSMTKNNRS
ncbi:MAG: hypothetical protein QW279_09580 [Candidatus Jordarchaeaceae archaeon]